MLPEISNYSKYSSENYGYHTIRLDYGGCTFWYSYDTIVAYRDSVDGKVVCQNIWGTTTGKHLNWIDGGDKRSRKPHEDFTKMLNFAIQRHVKVTSTDEK